MEKYKMKLEQKLRYLIVIKPQILFRHAEVLGNHLHRREPTVTMQHKVEKH